MPWFKVDDTLHSHPKARGVSLAAMGLWSMCGSYCMAYKTDGFVPAWFVAGFPRGRTLAAELARAGLWASAIRNDEKGWQFHDWTDYQPSSDEIEREREASRERQRRYREERRKKRNDGAGLTASVTRDVMRDSQPPVPTRPDPTRPALYRTTRVETSHHGVGLGNAGARNAMMTATRPEVAA